MKLRMHANSIRLRLSRADVAHLANRGVLRETVDFGPGAQLSYAIEASADLDVVRAQYENGIIRVMVPAVLARELELTDREGISAQQAARGLEPLKILIEKDFQCIHKSVEENADAYPNPLSV